MGRLATVRLVPPQESPSGVITDLLFSSSGIESEVASCADRLEIFPGLTVPVAAIPMALEAGGAPRSWLVTLAAPADDSYAIEGRVRARGEPAMMNTRLSIQPPRWLVAFLALGMALVCVDLADKRSTTPAEKPVSVAVMPVPDAQSEFAELGRRASRQNVPARAVRDPRRLSFSPACGCVVDYADGMSPPCSIRFANGSLMMFDHLYRPSLALTRATGLTTNQFFYDEQDRVTYARYDPNEAVYYFNKDGILKEIRHFVHGGRAEVIHPRYTIERGVRTRYPHELPHPHVPANSAMGHVLAGTWKAFER